MTEPLDKNAILSMVERVKTAHYKMHPITGQPSKICQWCNIPIYGIEAFCSHNCKTSHDKALQDYNLRRKDEEERRWAR